MTAFRAFLALIFLFVVGYTVPVVAEHGFNLFPVFFGDIAAMGWPGQFNVDFMGMLALSGFWLAWRHDFSPAGILLGIAGFLGGAPVLTAYLFLASVSSRGDVKVMLLGEDRARGGARQG